MIPYEEYQPLLPHEYTYAQFLSYEFDLWMYDPMILNMVSERYPRDEDYASDSVDDSDFVTSEDYNSDFGDEQYEIPPWFFQELEDEDVSLLLHENNRLKIVFGNFHQVSDLETISVAPLIPMEPEFDGFSIKIGEILCPVAAVKPSNDSDDGDSIDNDATALFVEHESNAVKEIKTGFNIGFTSCNDKTEDEAGTDLFDDRVRFFISVGFNIKDEILFTTAFVWYDFVFTMDPDLAKRLQKDASENAQRECISEISDSATRYGANVIFNTSKPVRLTWIADQAMETRFDFAKEPVDPVAWSSSPINISYKPDRVATDTIQNASGESKELANKASSVGSDTKDEVIFFHSQEHHQDPPPPQVENYCCDHMHLALAEEMKFVMKGLIIGNSEDDGKDLWENAFTNSVLKVDVEVWVKVNGEPVASRTIGSTNAVAMLCSSHIIVLNCDDSRVVLCRGKEPMALFVDHEPNREDEGKVMQWNGLRVFGNFATIDGGTLVWGSFEKLLELGLICLVGGVWITFVDWANFTLQICFGPRKTHLRKLD